MASPVLQSFCCVFANISKYDFQQDVTLQSVGFRTYNVLCIVSSSLSIIGATYQLWPKSIKSLPQGRKESAAYIRQNCLICCLAVADLFASLGVFVRSSVWFSGHIPEYTNDVEGNPDFAHIFCAVSSGWIQYFYNCTYFWTFCYALDTYLVSCNKTSYMYLYHSLGWIVTGVITGAGLILLYYPSVLRCEHTLSHLIPHYLSSYLLILLVMIANPVLYFKVSRSVHDALLCRGRYTNHERNIMSSINEKFYLVNVIFYVCWFPNILNGILMVFHERIPLAVFIGLWQFMALVNPVQALLNVLVYRGTNGLRCTSWKINRTGIKGHIQDTTIGESTEHSPLLAYKA